MNVNISFINLNTAILCEMSGCGRVMDESWAVNIYGGKIGRFIRACEDCHEEYTNAMAYGHPDMAYQWLLNTQDELAVTN